MTTISKRLIFSSPLVKIPLPAVTAIARVGVADAFVSAGNPLYPNEPAGYVPFSIADMTTYPTTTWAPIGGAGNLGNWKMDVGDAANLTAVTDSGLSIDFAALQYKWPAGLAVGHGTANLEMWHTSGKSQKYHSIYYSRRFRFPLPDYENQATGTKFGFWGVGDAPSTTPNGVLILLKGTGTSGAIQTNCKLEIHIKNLGTATQLPQYVIYTSNQGTGNLLQFGIEHHLEMLMTVNDVGSSNGIVRIWIDNQLYIFYNTIVFIGVALSGPTRTTLFHYTSHSFTWGGNNLPNKSRDDSCNLGHIYMSGVP